MAPELDERLLAGADPEDAVAVAGEVAADELADRGLVLDEQNGAGHHPECTAAPGAYLSLSFAASGRVTSTCFAGAPSTPSVRAMSPTRTAAKAAEPAVDAHDRVRRDLDRDDAAVPLQQRERRAPDRLDATAVVDLRVADPPRAHDVDLRVRPAGRKRRRGPRAERAPRADEGGGQGGEREAAYRAHGFPIVAARGHAGGAANVMPT